MAFTPDRGDFRELARANRRRLASLPPVVGRVLRQVRNAYDQKTILEAIDAAVLKLAEAKGLASRRHREVGPSYDHIAEDVRRDLVERLVRRDGFLRSLDLRARALLREHNVRRSVFREAGLQLVERFPDSSPFQIRGSNRFNRIEATFESMPVGLAAAIGNRMKRATAAALPESLVLGHVETVPIMKPINVLSWHCGIAGTLSLVLDHMQPRGRYVAIVEADVFGDLRDRETFTFWSGANRSGRIRQGDMFHTSREPAETFWHDEMVAPLKDIESPVVERVRMVPITGQSKRFDFVVLDMPAPGEGVGAQLRNTYKSERERTRKLFDPGRLGVRRWKDEALLAYLFRLPDLLKEGGEAIVILPAGIRHARGYHFAPGLVEHADGLLEQAGLELVNDLWVIEESPVPQPFVGRTRPERRVLIARRPR